MFTNHPAARALRTMGAFSGPAVALDSAAEAAKVMDAVAAAGAAFAIADIRVAAATAIQAWVATDGADLDEGESLSDRLLAFFIGIADENKDGEITDDESTVIDIALNAAFDYLTSKGVSEDDASALLNDGDSDAADRVIDLLKGSGAEDSMADVDAFAFDAESSESLMDCVLDAVYKKRMVIRAGKKVRINKRISGTVRLSAAQKVSIRKAGMKSRSAGARMHRMKSMRMRSRMGLK